MLLALRNWLPSCWWSFGLVVEPTDSGLGLLRVSQGVVAWWFLNRILEVIMLGVPLDRGRWISFSCCRRHEGWGLVVVGLRRWHTGVGLMVFGLEHRRGCADQWWLGTPWIWVVFGGEIGTDLCMIAGPRRQWLRYEKCWAQWRLEFGRTKHSIHLGSGNITQEWEDQIESLLLFVHCCSLEAEEGSGFWWIMRRMTEGESCACVMMICRISSSCC